MAPPRCHGTAEAFDIGGAEHLTRQRQHTGILEFEMGAIHRHEAERRGRIQRGRSTGFDLLQLPAQAPPQQRQPVVFQRQRFGQIAGAGRACLFQQRKQVAFFIVMMVNRRGVEVGQHRARGLLGLRVGTVFGQMGQQFIQGVALFGDATVTGLKHLQRPVETRGRRTQQAGRHGLRVSRDGAVSGCVSK